MLDNRIYTFLKLCRIMNYRKTAEELNMTQPAVTQHIQFLENQYQCKLFLYNGKRLFKTAECEKLEKYSRSILYNDIAFKRSIATIPKRKLVIGATKTIGDYVIKDKIINLLKQDDIELELIIDNTEVLLNKLNALEIDILLLEGYFNKNNYDFKLIKREQLVGICSRNHPFADKAIDIEQLFKEKIILREKGSGTRAVFEKFLYENNYTYQNFSRKSFISSFNLIVNAVSEDCGISFVYEAISKSNKHLSTFTIKDHEIFHEFNFVYLKNTSAYSLLNLLE